MALSFFNLYQLWINTLDGPLVSAMDVAFPGPFLVHDALEWANSHYQTWYERQSFAKGGFGYTVVPASIPVTSVRYGLLFQILYFFVFITVIGNIFVVWLIQIVGCTVAERNARLKEQSLRRDGGALRGVDGRYRGGYAQVARPFAARYLQGYGQR